jgi:hypothetical protein
MLLKLKPKMAGIQNAKRISNHDRIDGAAVSLTF